MKLIIDNLTLACSGHLMPGFELIITSALVTQHLQKSKLVIWMDEPWETSKDTRKREIVKLYRFTPYGFVEFRLLNVKELAQQSASCWKHRPESLLGKRE